MTDPARRLQLEIEALVAAVAVREATGSQATTTTQATSTSAINNSVSRAPLSDVASSLLRPVLAGGAIAPTSPAAAPSSSPLASADLEQRLFHELLQTVPLRRRLASSLSRSTILSQELQHQQELDKLALLDATVKEQLRQQQQVRLREQLQRLQTVSPAVRTDAPPLTYIPANATPFHVAKSSAHNGTENLYRSQLDNGDRSYINGSTPGTAIVAKYVPCKARGVSKSHDEKAAFLTIPQNVKHGKSLLCSNIECQNRGIRFVYCKVCDHAVAKNNFTTRHNHPEVMFGVGEDPRRNQWNSSKQSMSTSTGEPDHHTPIFSSKRPARQSTKSTCGVGNKRRRTESATYPTTVNTSTRRPSFDDSPSSSCEGDTEKDERNLKATTRSSVSAVSTSSTSALTASVPYSEENRICFPDSSARPNDLTNTGSAVMPDHEAHTKWQALLDERPRTKDSQQLSLWLHKILLFCESIPFTLPEEP